MIAMELYLLRHAHAGDPAKWTGDDAVRPLSAKGRSQCERLGSFLAGIGFQPDAIVSSPKVRALETAELIAEFLGIGVTTDDRLVIGFDLAALGGLVRDTGEPARLVVVGHDPDFSDLLAELTDAPSILMRKGALARVDLELPPAPGAGTLRWLVPPELLERASVGGRQRHVR
jgi:phosphohistidine phosphatase